MRIYAVLCISLMLSGCWQSNQAMADKTIKLVGKPISALIGAIGYPDEIKDYGDNQLYTWRHSQRNIGSTTPDLFCDLNTEVSKDGIIVGSSYNGAKAACSTLLAFEHTD